MTEKLERVSVKLSQKQYNFLLKESHRLGLINISATIRHLVAKEIDNENYYNEALK